MSGMKFLRPPWMASNSRRNVDHFCLAGDKCLDQNPIGLQCPSWNSSSTAPTALSEASQDKAKGFFGFGKVSVMQFKSSCLASEKALLKLCSIQYVSNLFFCIFRVAAVYNGWRTSAAVLIYFEFLDLAMLFGKN